MSGKKSKELRKVAKKISVQAFSQILAMPFKVRWLVAWRILLGERKESGNVKRGTGLSKVGTKINVER